jgi:membrane-associated phospholipid phosphatase
VWAPATLSLLLQIEGLDGRLSAWARRETPVFGSQARAQNASNVLLDASVISYAALLVVTPAPHGLGPWLHDKSKRGMAGLGAAAATDGITVLVKDATDRTRPDASNDLSFPSGHASGSAVAAALAAGEADRLRAPGWARSAIVLGTGAIAGGCGWARVEAGRHYPSDVLAGWALGTALGTITSQALAGDHGSPAVSVRAGRRRVQVALTLPLTSPGRIRDSD